MELICPFCKNELKETDKEDWFECSVCGTRFYKPDNSDQLIPEINNNERKCINCGMPIKGDGFMVVWENDDYIKCPHCGHINVK